MTAFRWDKTRRRAAVMVAENRHTDEQIATECGVSRQSLWAWRQRPEFKERVESILAELQAALVAKGIADRQNRLDYLNDRHEKMRRVIDERAADPIMDAVAGGTTGLLAHRQRQLGGGRNATVIDEYEVDTGLLAEMRATEKQAAQELGEWTEKHDIKGNVLIREYGGFDPSEV